MKIQVNFEDSKGILTIFFEGVVFVSRGDRRAVHPSVRPSVRQSVSQSVSQKCFFFLLVKKCYIPASIRRQRVSEKKNEVSCEQRCNRHSVLDTLADASEEHEIQKNKKKKCFCSCFVAP